MSIEHFDVLIIGAGLSGIGTACHLRQHCPQHSFAILEGRERSGGTWDLFRYPGVRSDSDMYTLGYSFKPWEDAKAIADGPSILNYVRVTAREYGVESHIRLQHKVRSASWSTAQARWTLDVERGAGTEPLQMSCDFLLSCTGYYDYARGYTPDFPGIARFGGRIVHPQHWPEELDYSGQRVIVIGSGATAVTLVPAMARKAAHVTMLQRSPTYMIAWPSEDAVANGLRRLLPSRLAYAISRWKQILLTQLVFNLCRRYPVAASRQLLAGVRKVLGPGFDVERHFTPRYKPWEQRLCLMPEGDLLTAIKSGQASVVTDEIESFTETGVQLKSGATLAADLIVTATGLNLQWLGGLQLSVDGKPVTATDTLNYKGLMFSGVPNMAAFLGYTNASWTLKSDLTAQYVCRLLNHMRRLGLRTCTPGKPDASITAEPWVDFSSGYYQRARKMFPDQGSKVPWKLQQNYARDILGLRWGKLEDGVLAFA